MISITNHWNRDNRGSNQGYESYPNYYIGRITITGYEKFLGERKIAEMDNRVSVLEFKIGEEETVKVYTNGQYVYVDGPLNYVSQHNLGTAEYDEMFGYCESLKLLANSIGYDVPSLN